MIADFQCQKCGEVVEEYFPTFKHLPKEIPCKKCGDKMLKMLACPHIQGGVVWGYEKENQDNLTLGKAIDFKQKWV